MRQPNYDKSPRCEVKSLAGAVWQGWEAIGERLRQASKEHPGGGLVVEAYPGVRDEEVLGALTARLAPQRVIATRDLFKPPSQIDALVQPDLTDDPVFGRLTGLGLEDFFDAAKLAQARAELARAGGRETLVYGPGASLVASGGVLVYADLPRWEAQNRFRRREAANLGAANQGTRWPRQYKRAFFVDWRVADRRKRETMSRWDFVLDTTSAEAPKLATGAALRAALREVAHRPFRVVPFFDPAPWGGQWLEAACGLEAAAPNYGWCFDCVPEENSLCLGFGDGRLELPALDLVFQEPRALLGETVLARFGAEFPIRFDFLDTMGGGNLSLQVHPLAAYAREQFGIPYTQDESYYLVATGPDAAVFLGLKEGVDPAKMQRELHDAQAGGRPFDAEQYVNRWPARPHDHFSIPAGTIHCSGANSLVLEISATPYLFTFKLWDWGRLGLDGQPRPVHLEHGAANLQWDRRTEWVRRELLPRATPLAQGDTWREERTGLDASQFIETRRHWFAGRVPHDTAGNLNVLNLVAGEEAIVESPDQAFEPFIVHYAESFIVPAVVGPYSVRPFGAGAGQSCGTIKAFVRSGGDCA